MAGLCVDSELKKKTPTVTDVLSRVTWQGTAVEQIDRGCVEGVEMLGIELKTAKKRKGV